MDHGIPLGLAVQQVCQVGSKQKVAAKAIFCCGDRNLDKYPWGVYSGDMKQDIKKKAVRRLKILEGQVRGLQRMVHEEKYCIDIINQSLAAKEALSGVEDLILENHLSTHVIEQMRSGKEKKAINEILSVYKVSKKK